MHLNLLPSTPGILFLKSVALLAMSFFVPYWALFYHHEHEFMVFASPWIICVRKQCKIIKNIGHAEGCRASLLMSLLLSLPLGLSVPAQCTGILSSSLPELMPFFTSLICLTVGSVEFLAFVFFRLMLNRLQFLLREFDVWLNWPAYLLLFSSVIYFVVGSFLFHHHLHHSTSMTQSSGMQSAPQSPEVSQSSDRSLVPKDSEQPETSQTKTPMSSRASESIWAPRPIKPSFSLRISDSGSKSQRFRTSFSQMFNRSWSSEQPWVSQNPKTSSYPLGFRVQSISRKPPCLNHSSSQSSTSRPTDL